jgi:hypothetical protein
MPDDRAGADAAAGPRAENGRARPYFLAGGVAGAAAAVFFSGQ